MAALEIIKSETGKYRENIYKIDKDLLIKLRSVSRGGLLNDVIEKIDELEADENGFYLIDCPSFYDIMSMFSEKTGINVRHQPSIPEDATEMQIKWHKEIENVAKEVCTFGEFDKESTSTIRLIDDFEIVKEFIDDPEKLLTFLVEKD